MAYRKVGRRLLIVAVVLTLYVWCVAIKAHQHDTRSVVKQLKDLRTYMEELEFIKDQEVHQGLTVKDTSSVEEDVMLEACNLMVKNGIKVNLGDDFGEEAKADVQLWDNCLRLWTNKQTIASWNFETDITDSNEKAYSKASLDFSNWNKGLARNAKAYMDNRKYSTLDPDLQRKIRFMAFSTDPKDEEDMRELIDVQARLQQTYSEATVDSLEQDASKKNLKLEPDLTEIMATSRDSNLLFATWWGWHNATGPSMRNDYADMVRLLNKGAEEHYFTDYAEAWMLSQFDETYNLEEIAEHLWNEIRPLYEQLHAYVRTELQKKYPEYNDIFNSGGIPAHLLGNMWAQNWENIYDIVIPYPEVKEPDYDAELKARGYTVDQMFKTAETFYTSIGLYPMSKEFNRLSMKVRPADKEVVCHASASDFLSAKPQEDFRIKMCTEIDMASMETIHHEMGHIEYFMAYQEQPAIFRNGANSAFHEAIGDTISLSVRSSKHLKAIGLDGDKNERTTRKRIVSQKKRLIALLRELEDRKKHDINFLLKRALYKIGFLPFGYMIDIWRWNVFKGKTTEKTYNKDWWTLRLKYQGLVSPATRSESDFDPGAKFHIPSNSPYICYFISFIVQFQFYKAMCDESGHTGPLFECDFYKSKDAGQKLLDMMKLGNSRPWPEAMEILTGSREINTAAILEYFEPLHQWLQNENARTGAQIGWQNAKINWKS